MTDRTKGILSSALPALAIVLVGLVSWREFYHATPTEPGAPRALTVLCAKEGCEYSNELSPSQLIPPPGGRAARMPIWGPGYKCPKCGQQTLYTCPIQCPVCGTLFLLKPDARGPECPKCGKDAF